MKFTLTNNQNNAIEYDVKFVKPRNSHTTTYCSILYGAPGSRAEDKKPLAEGKARKWSSDTPNLVVARTVALARALKDGGLNKNDAMEAVKKLGIRYRQEYLDEVYS